MKPVISEHFSKREPSVIRLAQIEFARRKDSVKAINVAIGNVCLPMHPAMVKRMTGLQAAGSPFEQGQVKYTPTGGVKETQEAFRNIIASSGFSSEHLHVQVTDGGSQAMELMILGVCGPAGTDERPLMIIDPTYTNYTSFALRLGRNAVSINRTLDKKGHFSLPEYSEIERIIIEHKPGSLLVIPYDNPTGQFYSPDMMMNLGRLCIKHNLWMISDEAYRELNYTDSEAVSIWGLTDRELPGIEGRRISIESASKVWNACGLRIGALITDNEEFIRRAEAEYTANLCPNAIGQYIFGSLAHESHQDLRSWYKKQISYYRDMLSSITGELKKVLPGIIVSFPSASIYSVVDVREITSLEFNALDFVMYCAQRGKVLMEDGEYTLLVAPMYGFYKAGENNPGLTQMRIAYVESPDTMKKVPILFKELLHQFRDRKIDR